LPTKGTKLAIGAAVGVVTADASNALKIFFKTFKEHFQKHV